MTGAERALEDAVRAAIAEGSPGTVVTAWVVVAAVHTEEPGASPMTLLWPDGQPAYSSRGLLLCALTDGTVT